MNNISWRHHYLPVFYLKGFTKETGKFKIYNVQTNKFVQNGKEFSPESYFYEKDANTIFQSEGKSDFIESAYSDLESKISKLIIKIDSSDSESRYNVTEDDMPMLNTFVSLIYWRLPNNREELKTVINRYSIQELGFKIQDKKTGKPELEAAEQLKKDPEFLKAYKFFTSLFDTVRGSNCRTPYTILSKHEKLPFLCSDNPIIFEKDDFPNVHTDDYIMPLSGKRIFIKANNGNVNINYLWPLIDTVIYKQAKNYVSCTDEIYISLLDSIFEKHGSLAAIKKQIFSLIK